MHQCFQVLYSVYCMRGTWWTHRQALNRTASWSGLSSCLRLLSVGMQLAACRLITRSQVGQWKDRMAVSFVEMEYHYIPFSPVSSLPSLSQWLLRISFIHGARYLLTCYSISSFDACSLTSHWRDAGVQHGFRYRNNMAIASKILPRTENVVAASTHSQQPHSMAAALALLIQAISCAGVTCRCSDFIYPWNRFSRQSSSLECESFLSASDAVFFELYRYMWLFQKR